MPCFQRLDVERQLRRCFRAPGRPKLGVAFAVDRHDMAHTGERLDDLPDRRCLGFGTIFIVMRELEPGLTSACVQNGLGTARGTLTGIGAAELACGETSAITAHFLKEPDPAKLPPIAIRDLGANVVLRWKEWKARKE